MASVLVVDDDTTVASVVASYLQREGHVTTVVHDGRAALTAIDAGGIDLIVLDLMLPEVDGLEVCRHVRATRPSLPVVMLTALGDSDDRIVGLEVGADDYIAKPFSPRELVLRVDAVLRRATRTADPQQDAVLTAGGITVDTAARRAWRGTRELALTLREMDLLSYLLAHPGTAFSREHLMHQVWGWTYGDQSTVTVHVRRLRTKIEDDPTHPQIITTVWGVGYRLEGDTALPVVADTAARA